MDVNLEFQKIKTFIKNALIELHKEKTKIKIEGANSIVLVGATPFAQNVFKLKDKIFPEKTVIIVDQFEDINKVGGGCLFFAQGLMLSNI